MIHSYQRPVLGTVADSQAMQAWLAEELQRSQRSQPSPFWAVLSVGLQQAPHFGQTPPDPVFWNAVLREACGRIHSVVRGNDRVFCDGDNSFVIWLPSTDLVGANALAQRLTAFLCDQPYVADRQVPISVSIGSAGCELKPGLAETHLGLLKQALNQAQHQRRESCHRAMQVDSPLSPFLQSICFDDWSESTGRGLSAEERIWAQQLAVLPQSFDRPWAEQTLGVPVDVLDQLLAKGCVTPHHTRLAWLTSAREHFRAELERQPDQAAQAQRWVVSGLSQWLQRRASLLDEPHPEPTLRELDIEWPNLCMAIDWTISADEPELGLALIAPAAKYCLLRGRIQEGCDYMDEILSLASLTTAHEFVQVMIVSGELQERLSDLEQAFDRYQTAFTLATLPNMHQPDLAAQALLGLARIHLKQHMEAHAVCYAQKAVELAQASGNAQLVAMAKDEMKSIFDARVLE